MNPAILTIDDVPSTLFREKLEFLTVRSTPAVLFCWGEKLKGREDELAEAVRRGFVVGNHAWSHPAFSGLTLTEARQQIAWTEDLLDEVHRRAGVARGPRLFRFPYLDAGKDEAQRADLQALLAEFGFRGLPADGERLDCGCSFDQREYDPEQTPASLFARIVPGSPGPGDRILIHDHEASHDVFFQCIDRYLALGLTFAVPADPVGGAGRPL